MNKKGQGRPNLPDEEKAKRGTLRKSRIKNHMETEVVPEIPPPPDFLNDDGLAEWHKKSAHLFRNGVLSTPDVGALGALCKEWQNYLAAERACDGNARYYALKDDAGKVRYWGIHPAHTIAQQHLKAYISLCNEFGATPASRSNLNIKPEKAKTASILDLIKGGTVKDKVKTG